MVGIFTLGSDPVDPTHPASLLDTILRKQWGWDGMIMSDWFGTYSADTSVKAGLDLEMPGPPIWRGSALQRCVVSQKIRVAEIDDRVRQVLKLINKVSVSGIPEDAEESGNPTEETVHLLREAAASANVLLKNDSGLLPLNSPKLKSIAVIGPNADAPVYSGGGSTSLRPFKHTTALEGIRSVLEYSDQNVKVHFAMGALAHKEAPLLGARQLKTKDGKPGMDIEWFHEDPLENPGIHEFGAAADGLVDVYVDGKKVVDNSTNPTPGHLFFGAASNEKLGMIDLEAGKPVTVVVQYASPLMAQSRGYPASEYSSFPGYRGVCRFGGGPAFTVEDGIQEAVRVARSYWESESYDRADLSLPGATNELVSAALEANKQTIVIVISGTPVAMPWAATASTIVQSFYGGGESGNGLADILFGRFLFKLIPSQKEEDTPSYLNFPGQNGKVHHAEGVFVGYRHYLTLKKEVLYTRFKYLDISLSGKIGPDSQVEVSITIKNLGQVSGREVVQIYVRDVISRLDRPVRELKGFGKSKLVAPGGTDQVNVTLDRYAFAYFDDWAGPDGRDGHGRWVAEAGEFEIIAASSSADGELTDGPNGARGTKFFEGVPAACFPGATGLAASWDVEYLRSVGKTIALDCKDKGAHVLLGPTVNIQRSPLGGRGFESYSEDPLLSGNLAQAFVNGLQSEGVAATIKHFVANDSEFERMSISSEVSTRALREIYLRPFELVCRDSKTPAWAVMTAYNRVNGLHASENKHLLDTILRKQWGWEGLIMSDWFGTSSVDASIKAGLDLEMPGPAVWRGDALQRYLALLNTRKVLRLINKVAASEIPEDAEETGNPTEEIVEKLRESARNANVLLKNDDSILPLKPSELRSIAVIGPNADAPVFSGGGSANLRPYQHTTVLEGIQNTLKETGRDVKLEHVIGALSHKLVPLLGVKQLITKEGNPGFDIEWFHEDPTKNPDAERVHYTHGTHSSMWFIDNLPDYLNPRCWATITATYTSEFSGK
ncbi:unnamed protein product, partial [Rhizoctonia solani]